MKTWKDVVKDDKPNSIWDKRVDPDKLAQLSKEERARLFPNDYDINGNAYGDF